MQRWRHGAALGVFLREQRRLADLSLRELAALTSVSNAYLSQIERGLHQPSFKVLQAIGQALGVPPASLLAEAGMLDERAAAAAPCGDTATERAIHADPHLTQTEKHALVAVYRSYADRGGEQAQLSPARPDEPSPVPRQEQP